MKLLFEKCPECGGEVSSKIVEKILKGNQHTAILKVRAEVCLHCGERLYDANTIKKFEEVRRKLKTNAVKQFKLIGKTYAVA